MKRYNLQVRWGENSKIEIGENPDGDWVKYEQWMEQAEKATHFIMPDNSLWPEGTPKPVVQRLKKEKGAYIAITCPKCGEPINSTPAKLKTELSDRDYYECVDSCSKCEWRQSRNWAEYKTTGNDMAISAGVKVNKSPKFYCGTKKPEDIAAMDKEMTNFLNSLSQESRKPTICAKCKNRSILNRFNICNNDKNVGLTLCRDKNHGNCGDFEEKENV